MKKKLFKILVFIILLLPCYVHAEDISYENAQKIVKEVMQAWYMRGSYRQYNSSKNLYFGINHPEDSTSQDMGYSVCTGFTNVVYQESFGTMAASKDALNKTNIPTVSKQYCLHTEDYIAQNSCQIGTSKTGCNGEYAIYFENKAHQYKKEDGTVVDKAASSYFYNTSQNPTVAEFAQNIKPGDLFAYYTYNSTDYSYAGHAMIAYEVAINPNTNKLDVLLLQSGGASPAGEIKTKIDPTSYSTRRLYYRNALSTNTNNLIDLNVSGSQMTHEGTINNAKWLSDVTQIVNNEGKISCKVTSCSVSRFFYEDANHNAKFYYDVKEEQIKNSMVRTKLPGVFIHKTADSLDNNSVYPEQTITYTIKIANQSNVNKKDGGKNYSKFYVSEVIPTENVEFVSASNNGQYSNGKITWTINSLAAEQNITLTYTVKVKNTTEVIGKRINVEGTVYVDNTGSITTGVVSNEVIRKPATKKDTYKNCYNKYKDSKSGLDLVNEVYKCSYDVDLNLGKFSLDGEDNNMISKLIKQNTNTNGNKNGAISLINNEETKNYYNMILNDYWSSNILMKNGAYYLGSWRTSDYRADTIYDNHFKDGDILIYLNDDTNTKDELKFTKEQGIYAYIYLDGKFVGQNQTGDAVRNEFTYEYYPEETRGDKLINSIYNSAEELTFVNYQTLFGKDYYVILRPEKIIESSSTKIDEDSTTVEVPNTGKKESLYLILIGSLMVISGSIVIFKKRKA